MIIKMKKIFKCIIRKNEYILSDDLFLIELYLTQRKISLPYKILEYSKKEVKKSLKGYNTYNENCLNYLYGFSITNKELEFFNFHYNESIHKIIKNTKKKKKRKTKIKEYISLLINEYIIENSSIVEESIYNITEYKYCMDKD